MGGTVALRSVKKNSGELQFCSYENWFHIKNLVTLKKISDPHYSSDLLEAAKSLYDFAKRNQGTYGVTSVQDVNGYYQ